MSTNTLIITARLPGEPHESLGDIGKLILPEAEVMSAAELRSHLPNASGVLTMLSHRIDAPLLELAPQLKVISNYAVGYNNIDLEAAAARGIVVCNTPDVLTETTADLAWALLLATARRVVEADRYLRAGRFTGWSPTAFLGRDIHAATLGIIGLGRIGAAVARRATGFGMRILHHSPNREAASTHGLEQVSWCELDELLAQSDFVSLHCPLTTDTHHLLDAKRLTRMRPGAILINTARGPVVDEAALAAALERGHLGGAGLDVYEEEPRVEPRLLNRDDVVLLPHIGSSSTATRIEMGRMACQALRDVLSGQAPAHRII